MEAPIRTGVIGFGLAGRVFHAAVVNAVPGLELAGIVQRSGNLAHETYPAARIFRSVEELLADDSIPLVVVGTPTPSHYAVARQCLNAGKHVVVDKPITLTSAELVDLIALSRSKKLLLSAFHNRRWDGDFLTLQKIIASDSLGRITAFESHFDRFRPNPKVESWRESGGEGGGVLYDLGSHLIDQALVLFGAPRSLYAEIRIEREQATIDDAFDILLHYPHLTVLLRSTCLAAIPGARFTLNGAGGSFVKYGLDPQEDDIRKAIGFDDPSTTNHAALFKSGWGTEDEGKWGTLQLEGKEAKRMPTEPGDYRAYYANIRDTLLGKAALAVTAEQAWRTARIMEQARESSDQQRTLPVDFSAAP